MEIGRFSCVSLVYKRLPLLFFSFFLAHVGELNYHVFVSFPSPQ